MKNRYLCILVVLSMVVGLFQVSAYAGNVQAPFSAFEENMQTPFSAFADNVQMPSTHLAENIQPSSGDSSTPDRKASVNPFSDVTEMDWFYDSVLYVYQNDIFKGTAGQTFSPWGTMTRGMYVTVMGRIAGINPADYSGNGGFCDVSNDDWYAPFVVWAAKKGITRGVGNQQFDPDGLVTREQMAVLTVRFFDTYGIPYPEEVNLTKPADFSSIADYAQDAVMKLWRCGLLQGDSNGCFNPKNNATRAEAAVFCMRTDVTVQQWRTETGLKLEEPDRTQNPTPIASPTPEPGQPDKPGSQVSPTPKPAQPNNPGSQATPTPEPNSDDNDTTYTISFNCNGGNSLAAVTKPWGAFLANLPVPFRLNSVFSGWYYDETLQHGVQDTDTVKENLTLYAKYVETAALEEKDTPQFATRLDQPVNFSFIVLDPSGDKTAADIKTAINAENITNPTQTDFIEVTGSNGRFVVSAAGGEFEDGATYKVMLEDETLLFEGYGNSVRTFNFTTAKEEVLNLSLNEGLIYIAASDVSNATLDGGPVASLSIPVAAAGTDLASFNLRSGTFTYTKSTLAVGDIVAIYAGVRPDLRNINDNSAEGEVAYVKITQVDGTTYSYMNTQAEDVLFTPDVLPVNTVDDEDVNGTTFTVDREKMFYGGDAYAAMGLDATTTVDAGDYLAFYTGTFGDAQARDVAYGRITDVVEDDESNYIITYVTATESEIIEVMDIYDTQDVEGETLLEGVDVQALEKDIEQQAIDSGFAQEAASYLTALTLETNTFTELKDDFNLTDYSITLADASTGALTIPEASGEKYNILLADASPRLMGNLALSSDKKVSVENLKVNARIGTQLQHFEGLSGLRCALQVSFDIEISTGEESKIVIRVTGTFEEEVRIALNVSGGAIWKWAWIIPYIADYRLNANIDLYNYTGIGINATIATLEKEEEWEWDNSSMGQSIAKELKELLDAKDKYIGDGIGTVAGGLGDKYRAMLENESDWVELFSQDIFTQKSTIDPYGILAYEFGIKFVVSANMNISIGCDFYYENAKRYTYSIGVFSKECSNDVIDLVEEHYEFSFYVMGTMGLRAGIKLEIKVGLFSTDLNSVGLSAEAGVYVRVWGYFYYQLTYRASEGKKTKYSGALLFELGIYLEIGFEAQVFKGTFSYAPTLYENEWPLWSAGSRENVQDFAYADDEAPELALKKHFQTLTVPDDVFEMSYMDLKTGEEENKVYDDAVNFTISITNDAFSYDTATNTLKVSPEPGAIIEEGQMLITWKNAPLSFTSAPITRTLSLYWDNLNDGYSISFNTGGGSAVPMIVQRYNGAVTPPANPVRTGYVFGGWYADDALTIPYTIPAAMPNRDVAVYARWNPAKNTQYVVEHYQQNLNNNLYTLTDTETLYGTTDSTVSPSPKTYRGFNTPAAQNLTIRPDGSAVLRYYYTRKSYVLTFEPGAAGGDSIINRHKFGAAIHAPQMNSAGYDFAGWNATIAATMPAENLTYQAVWTARNDTAYRVEHYLQNTSGEGYALSAIDNRTGETADELVLESLKTTGAGLTYLYGTVEGSQVTTAPISSDGALVVKLYYSRNTYSVAWQVTNGTNQTTVYRYGEILREPEAPAKPGYLFSGWYRDEALTTSIIFGSTQMPAENITLYGKLTASPAIGYRVEHYVEQLNGSYALQDTEILAGTADSTVTLSERIKSSLIIDGGMIYREGKVDGVTKTEAIITGDGSLVIKLYYQRLSHTLTFRADNGNSDIISTVRYGAGIHAPANPVRAGYTFSGWDKPVAVTMPATDVTYTAVWTANTNTAYKVEHYRQNANDNGYALVVTEDLSGTTDTFVTAAAKTWDYFRHNADIDGTKNSGTIAADGSLIMKLYYDRSTYTVTYVSDGAQYGDIITFRYGAAVPAPAAPVKAGYSFNSWLLDGQTFSGIMPGKNIELTAKWLAGSKSYTIRYYKENLSGGYEEPETAVKTGTYDTEISIVPEKSYTGFNIPESQTVTLNNSLNYVDFYYTRNSYALTWNIGDGTANGSYTAAGSVKYGAPITPPVLTKTGYNYTWDKPVTETMPAADAAYTAVWTANTNTAYKVEHYRQNANDNGYTLYVTEPLSGTTDTSVTAVAKTYTGFTCNPDANGTVASGTIAADGSLIMKLYYDRSTYTITYVSDGTQYGDIITFRYGAAVPAPTIPVKEGYDFDLWQLDGQNFNGIMPAKNINLIAKWMAREKSYTVRYYQQNLSGGYDEPESIMKTGTYDAEVTVAPEKFYTGFTAPESQTVRLNSSLNYVDFYYTRNSYILTWNIGDGTASGSYTGAGLVKYGAVITPPILTKMGYSYTWDKPVAETMPAADAAYTAVWTANTNTAYKVEHYRQNANDNGYTLHETETLSGTTDTSVTAVEKTYTGFTCNPDANGTVASGTIAADGSLIMKLYYDRSTYTITYVSDGTQYGDIITLRYGAAVPAPTIPVKEGYDFDSWQLDGQSFSGIMPPRNIMLGAKWSAGEKSYTVRYYQQNLNGTYDEPESVMKTGTYDAEVTVAPEKTYTGFTTPESQTVRLNSSLNYVDFYYTRNSYTLTWNIGDGTASGSYTGGGFVKYGAVITPPILTKMGYSYTWDKPVAETMPAADAAYTAVWTANTNTAYKVEHYRQNANDNGYTLHETETLSSTTDTSVTAVEKTYTGFTCNPDTNGTVASGTIAADGSLIMKLYYDRSTYTVTYVSDGTQYGDITTFRYGAAVPAPTIPAKEGYDFDSWLLDGQNFNGIMPAKNINLTAKWLAREKSYTVRYYQQNLSDGFDSIESIPKTGTYDAEITVAPEKTYTGFTTPESQTVRLNSSLNYVDFYYTRNSYALTWNIGDGTASGSYTAAGFVKYGAPITSPVLTKTGYSYTWDMPVAETMPADDVTYTAAWTANSYTITFETNGGSIVEPVTGKHYGDVLSAPTQPTRTGYTFGGWYSDSALQTTFQFTTMPAQNVTLYAKWNTVSYGITYELNGGVNHSSNPGTFTIESTVTLGEPTLTGHTFAGWYTDSGFTTAAGSPAIETGTTGDKTFYASWTPNTYTILYNGLNGASNSNPSTCVYGSAAITLADPGERSGYTFAGWYQGETQITQIQTNNTGNVAVTAVWTVNLYSITYYSGGGSNAPGNPSTYTVEQSVILGNPTRTGYTFAGWYTDSGFTTAAGSPAIAAGSTGEKAFYARWTPNTYTVVFNANGGTGSMNNQSFTFDTEYNLSANGFSCAGYTFAGWATTANGATAYHDGQNVNNLTAVSGGTVTLYARWTPVTYTISYVLNSGTNNSSNPSTYTVETATINLLNPTRTDYVFGGWFDNSSFSGSALTVIPTGSIGNRTFYARWLNYGTFTVTNNGNNTFTITRSVGTDGEQKVYYRTLNGSAIGGTHFNHVSGSVIIPAGQASVSVAITENDVATMYANKAATAYSNADRVYFLEIYQVDGGGKLGGTTRAARTMVKNSSYTVDANYLNSYYQIASVNNRQQIYESSGGGYNGTVAIGLSTPVLNNSTYSANLQAYLRGTASEMKVQLRNFKGDDAGWRMWRFVLFNTSTGNVSFSSNKTNAAIPNLPTGTKCALVYGITSDTNNTDNYSVQLPANQGNISATGTSHVVSISNIVRADGQTGTDYVSYGINETCGITVGAFNPAAADSSWYFNSAELYARPVDVKEPTHIGTAPMANTSYKIGDRVTVALVFDEIVNSASNVSVNTNLSDTAFTLAGGLGTNVLYFEGTVTNTATALSVTSINNSANITDISN